MQRGQAKLMLQISSAFWDLNPFVRHQDFALWCGRGKSGTAAPIFSFVSVRFYPLTRGFLKNMGQSHGFDN
jgi:hypothetical protein